MTTITVPWPPALNRYYRHWNGRTLISREGRRYRKIIQQQAIMEAWPRLGRSRLRLAIIANPPDRRRRDLDGLFKCLLDSLERARLFDDDGQIDDLHILRGPVTTPGCCTIHIEEITNDRVAPL